MFQVCCVGVLRLLEEGKIEETDRKKDKVEEKQRERRKILAKKGEEHIPRFFRWADTNPTTDLFIWIRVGLLKCSHLTGKHLMLLEGKFGFTMERIGRSGIILVFPMLQTWNYGEEGRLLQHWGHVMHVINSVCAQFLKDFTNLALLGATMNCQGVFVLNRIHWARIMLLPDSKRREIHFEYFI